MIYPPFSIPVGPLARATLYPYKGHKQTTLFSRRFLVAVWLTIHSIMDSYRTIKISRSKIQATKERRGQGGSLARVFPNHWETKTVTSLPYSLVVLYFLSGTDLCEQIKCNVLLSKNHCENIKTVARLLVRKHFIYMALRLVCVPRLGSSDAHIALIISWRGGLPA